MITIMLVEDSIAVRTRVRELLGEMAQFRIIGEHDNATEAIAAIQAQPPQVLLLDIKLKASNGIEVMRFVHKNFPRTQVIVFSQHDDAEYREQFTQAGAQFFLNKTTEPGKLRTTLTDLATSI